MVEEDGGGGGVDDRVEDLVRGVRGWEAVEDAEGDASGGEVEAMRVVVKVGEESLN